MINVTDSDFSSAVLESEKPVLVDFWAEWCGPCKTIAPILKEISDEYSDKLTVAKVDVEANPNTPVQYSVRGIPALMIFNRGEVIGTKVGALSKSQLKAFIDECLG
jgi:thioredoxin 1|tara:strand:+ start:2154 stop:2471 length:318 start_codon:yes stop_codon:yes gene_type:complete